MIHSSVMLRRAAVVLVYALLLVGGWYLGGFLMELSDIKILPITEPAIHKIIMASTAIFVAASAFPFVPGAEIGLGMIFILGGRIAPLVYMSMVVALTISFLVGLLVPARISAAFFNSVGLSKARDLVTRLDRCGPEKRIELLFANAPGPISRLLVKHRYIALMALINTPGNSLIGGGGGIAFAAGLSRLFTLPRFLATIALAVAPVPLTYYLIS